LKRSINDRKAAIDAVQSLLECGTLAFDIETQPLFRYPKERTKTAYRAYFAYLKRNRWGLTFDPDPDDLPAPLPQPVDVVAEKQRIQRLIAGAPRSGKTAARRIRDLESALEALDDEVAPAWVMRHVARLLQTGRLRQRPGAPRSRPAHVAHFPRPVRNARRRRLLLRCAARRVGHSSFRYSSACRWSVRTSSLMCSFLLHNLGIFPKGRVGMSLWRIASSRLVSTSRTRLPPSPNAGSGETLDKSVRETFIDTVRA
jgi:hypothetical protein